MFSKADSGHASWTEHVPALAQGFETAQEISIIGADLTVFGDVHCLGDLQIFGVVYGDVQSRRLMIEAGAHIEGRVFAETLFVGGSIVGPVTATDISITGSARILGNIIHNSLTIEPGAHLEGRRPWRPRAMTVSDPGT